MKQTNKPKFKKYSFAENTEQSNIEDVPDSQTAENEAQGYIGYEHGYTSYNMRPITEGGKPPRGQQLNQLLNDITKVTQYSTVGGTYGIDEEVLNNTGYPKNAIICVDDVGLFRSLRDDNKESDYNDTSSWKKVVDFNPKFYQQRILGEVFFANRLDDPDGCLKCDGREYRISDYPRLQKYMGNGIVGYTSYSDYKSMVDSTGSCILFAWDRGENFKAPTLKCGTMLSNTYGQIKRYIAVDNYTPNFGNSLMDQIFNIQGYVGPLYSDVPLGYKVGLYDCVGNNAFAQTEINDTLNSSGYWHGLQGFRNNTTNKTVKIVFDASKICATGSQVLPRTAHLYAFVVVNDYFTTTLDFWRDDSNDPITPGDGVWELVEQYDFTDKTELEFTYNNNERYKLFLSNLTVNTDSPSNLIAKISPNGDYYIDDSVYFNNILRIGPDDYSYVGPYQRKIASFMCMDINRDNSDKLSKGDLTNIEIGIPKGFDNNKKQFILHSTRTKHNGDKLTYFNGITSIISKSFSNTGKIKIKIDDSINKLSGNVSFYKIN